MANTERMSLADFFRFRAKYFNYASARREERLNLRETDTSLAEQILEEMVIDLFAENDALKQRISGIEAILEIGGNAAKE